MFCVSVEVCVGAVVMGVGVWSGGDVDRSRQTARTTELTLEVRGQLCNHGDITTYMYILYVV